jgi:hypothetical protein
VSKGIVDADQTASSQREEVEPCQWICLGERRCGGCDGRDVVDASKNMHSCKTAKSWATTIPP